MHCTSSNAMKWGRMARHRPPYPITPSVIRSLGAGAPLPNAYPGKTIGAVNATPVAALRLKKSRRLRLGLVSMMLLHFSVVRHCQQPTQAD
jgi:hypothetical protein